MSRSELEATLDLYIRANGLPGPEMEHRFHPKRKFRFDFAWPEQMLAVEVEGGVWGAKSRHTTGAGFSEDCVKYNEAALLGWTVLRVTADHIYDGRAIDWIRRALAVQGAEPAPF